jgi:hypothetical protein
MIGRKEWVFSEVFAVQLACAAELLAVLMKTDVASALRELEELEREVLAS